MATEFRYLDVMTVRSSREGRRSNATPCKFCCFENQYSYVHINVISEPFITAS